MKHRRMLLIAGLILGLAKGVAVSAPVTYYVDGSNSVASDDNPGSQEQPWKTIGKAASAMTAGDTAIINAGAYDEKVDTVRSGAAGNRITFKARGKVVTGTFNIFHDYITIIGFEMTAANEGNMMTITGSHCEILDNTIHDTGAQWNIIHMANAESENCLIKGNRYYSETGPGDDLTVIAVHGTKNIIEGNDIGPAVDIDAFRVWGNSNIIRNNYVHDAETSPRSNAHMDIIQTFGVNEDNAYDIVFESNKIINFDGQIGMLEANGRPNIRNWSVRNNVFANIPLQANIAIPNFIFVNNTLYNVGGGNGFIIYLMDDSEKGYAKGADIRNNIFITDSAVDSYAKVVIGSAMDAYAIIDHNLVATVDGFRALSEFREAHGINGRDPKFVDAAAYDFRLQADSPAVGKGIALQGFRDDYKGTCRPQGAAWDIGALEQVGPAGLGCGKSGTKKTGVRRAPIVAMRPSLAKSPSPRAVLAFGSPGCPRSSVSDPTGGPRHARR